MNRFARSGPGGWLLGIRSALAAVLLFATCTGAVASTTLTVPASISANEGVAFSGPVATFTTNDPSPVLANYTASIDWGDGVFNTGTITGPVAGVFTVTGSHTYTEDGHYTFAVKVSDAVDASASFGTGAATVDEGIFVLSAGAPINTMAGHAFVGAVATFNDPGSSDLPGAFTATVDWGDGTQSPGTISGSGGNFTVHATHTYAAALNGLFHVTVTEPSANLTIGPVGSPVTIAAASVTPPAVTVSPAPITASATVAFNGTVATFTTTDPSPVLGNYTASIDWGDGTNSTGTLSGPTVGIFTVTGSHTYAHDGTFGVFVVVHDSLDGSDAAATSTATAYAVYALAAGAPINVPEGKTFVGALATFTDTGGGLAASDLQATITWGDGGTSAGVVSGLGTTFTITGAHVYANEFAGIYEVAVHVPSQPTISLLAVGNTVTVTESDVLTPTGVSFQALKGAAFTGTVANFTDAYTGSTASNFAATINWGDGATTAGTVSGGSGTFAVSGTHTYAAAGIYAVSVTLTDVAPGTATATASSQATVLAPPSLSKAFGAPSVPLNGTTSLSFTVQNTNTTMSVTGVGFSDTLPAGLLVATPNGLTGSCGGGTITAVAGSGAVTLAGATLAASAACTFSVNVVGASPGTQVNTTTAVASSDAGTGNTATATLVVVTPPTIAKSFNLSTVNVPSLVSLTFTLANPPANTVALTGVGFTDVLPAGLQVGAGSGAACGGTLTTTVPGTITLSGATLAIGGQCSFSVTLVAVSDGSFVNVTGAVTSANGGTGTSATAPILVKPRVPIPTLAPWALALLAALLALGAIRFMTTRKT